MTYTVLFLCHNDEKLNIKHECNDYDQAEFFFWAMVMKLKKAHDNIDTNFWQITLSSIDSEGRNNYKYHFSKT